MRTTILIHAEAPAKPATGAPCNGCGVCCLMAPCPVGILVSRKRTGACVALQWLEVERRYRCGVLAVPADRLAPRWPRLAALWSRCARRWIAAGAGCDAAVEVLP